MNAQWHAEAQIYHIYPLGLTGAPEKNDFSANPVTRLSIISEWINHIRSIGCTAVYLGPLFESSSHGYDTVNYTLVDRRLGTNDDLKRLCTELHRQGIRIIFDAVFNHVGRDFPYFKDVQKNGECSQFKDWFSGISFSGKSPYNDNFSYEGWNGHLDLVKLNLKNDEVKKYLCEIAKRWVEDFDIDGLRIDAADCIDRDFLKELNQQCKKQKNDFWIVGEVVHGDYRNWADSCIDSVTNYEAYKGLYSSLNDANYFEIAHTLKRQFGEEGMYKNLFLYSFADNHDVNRVSSVLKEQANLYPLYCLLFTMPGIPTVYYGSEYGIYGEKAHHSDAPLRPRLNIATLNQEAPHASLKGIIAKLSEIRKLHSALINGSYREALVQSRQFGFFRENDNQKILVLLNSSDKEEQVTIEINASSRAFDLLNNEEVVIDNNIVKCILHPNWGRIIQLS